MPYAEQGLPFAPNSHTSFKAAQRVNDDYRQTITAAYLKLLKEIPNRSDEYAYLYLKHEGYLLARSSLSSIRAACIKTGLVKRSSEMAKSAMGRDVHTWCLTEKGRRVA